MFVDHASEALGDGERFSVLAHDDAVLVVIDAADDAVGAYGFDGDPFTLAASDTESINVGTFRGRVTLPCGP